MVNGFFIIFFLTILTTRVFLFFRPTPSPTIKGFRTHHWMYGLVGIFLGIILNSIVVYAIGLGLFIDELTYLLIRGKNHKDNYSMYSITGTILFVILIFFLRNILTSLVWQKQQWSHLLNATILHFEEQQLYSQCYQCDNGYNGVSPYCWWNFHTITSQKRTTSLLGTPQRWRLAWWYTLSENLPGFSFKRTAFLDVLYHKKLAKTIFLL